MKFGKNLIKEIILKWKNHYLDYNKLKKILSKKYFSKKDVSSISFDFNSLLNSELIKINNFYNKIINDVLIKLNRRKYKVNKEIIQEIDKIRHFILLNIIAIIKIVKKYNKKFNNNVSIHESKINFYIDIQNLLKKQQIYNCKILKDIYKKSLVQNFNDLSIFNIVSLNTLKNIRDNTNFKDYSLLPHNNFDKWDNKTIDNYLSTKLGINNELTEIIIPVNINLKSSLNEDKKDVPIYMYPIYFIWILSLLYFFLFGLDLMSGSFKVLSGSSIKNILTSIDNPIAGLCMGILATVLLQSSSTTTSIIVSMVGSDIISVQQAIPVIMGSNIGTSSSNTIVAHGHINNKEQFKKGFAGATVHDMFNILSVIVLLPFELITKAIFGKGFINFIAEEITKGLLGKSDGAAGEFETPLKKIVTPLVEKFMIIDKDIIKAQTLGCLSCISDSNTTTISNSNTTTISNMDYCELDDICVTKNVWNSEVMNADIITGGFLKDAGGDYGGGSIGLIISLFFLCFSLYNIVKTLHKLVIKSQGQGKIMEMIKKTIDYTPYLTMLYGMGITILVQSSSITTSVATPLVAMGVISLEQMLPLTLGANLGTVFTSIVASMVAESTNAMIVAFSHLMFNVFGILLWYPLPYMRQFPLNAAIRMGELISHFKWFGLFYIVYAFVIGPLFCYCLSLLMDTNTTGAVFGIFFLILFGLATLFLFKNFEPIIDRKYNEINYTLGFKNYFIKNIQQNKTKQNNNLKRRNSLFRL